MKLERKPGSDLRLSSETVSALIAKIGRGDQSALGILYDRTNRLLFGLILKILKDRAAAEEILLDVYTHVWKQAARYEPGGLTPLEWLITIARSHAIARMHWGKGERRVQRFASENPVPEPTVSPERQQIARDALSALTQAQRESLEWAYYSGLSCSEIAAQTGKPIGAIKTHARLGLGKFAESMRPAFERETGTTGGQTIEARKSN
jgi:RNA polymerase sigma-70 factor, ECF subfamily